MIVVNTGTHFRFIKIVNNSTLLYLKEKLPPEYCRVMLNGNVRTTFHEIICKSNRYMNSFIP